jgi:hypothetical protein
MRGFRAQEWPGPGPQSWGCRPWCRLRRSWRESASRPALAATPPTARSRAWATDAAPGEPRVVTSDGDRASPGCARPGARPKELGRSAGGWTWASRRGAPRAGLAPPQRTAVPTPPRARRGCGAWSPRSRRPAYAAISPARTAERSPCPGPLCRGRSQDRPTRRPGDNDGDDADGHDEAPRTVVTLPALRRLRERR